MKGTGIIVILLMVFFFANAQTPYSGGAGDGYAFGSLRFESTGLVDQYSGDLTISPNVLRGSGTVRLPSGYVIRSWSLCSADGRKILDGITPQAITQVEIPELPSGIYLLQTGTLDGNIHVSRLVILSP